MGHPGGPEGSTVRHLAAHTSGLSFTDGAVQARPGTRRIYSNAGFEVLGETVAAAAGMPFAQYLHEAVLAPLGMTDTRLDGSPAADAVSTVADLARFAAELQAPTLVHPSTLKEATSVAFPGVDGILPGYGRQKPNDWGLGFEIRDGKSPHWTGRAQLAAHVRALRPVRHVPVGRSRRRGGVRSADRPDFGPWAIEAWPPFTDGVLAALRG